MSGSEVYALRSPAPAPAPDQDEQLVVVRRAIYDARTQASHWRQVTGVANASEIADRRDRDADVLEHVLRQLIATQRVGARPGEPSAGCEESGGSDPRAATPAPPHADAPGGPPPPVTRVLPYRVATATEREVLAEQQDAARLAQSELEGPRDVR